jgi:hypothetical protein
MSNFKGFLYLADISYPSNIAKESSPKPIKIGSITLSQLRQTLLMTINKARTGKN